MRILLTIAVVMLALSFKLSAQNDFKTLDQKSLLYYNKGDYRNLSSTADVMFSQGMDYYYLRMRLGITAFNKQLYSSAIIHFNKALEFNSLDTISQEYIYYSYLYSGRNADAGLYLESIPQDKKSSKLKSINKPGLQQFYVGSGISGCDSLWNQQLILRSC
jgi:tetratricopeptide (TPR) repeat protein